MPANTLYDDDIVAWAEEQAAALRALSRQKPGSKAVDWTNLIEEVESLGRAQLHAVERNLTLIFSHLIKILSSPNADAMRHWRAEILAFQAVVRRQFAPSMRAKINLQDIWRQAVKEADASLTGHGEKLVAGLPDASPFNLDEMAQREFDPDRMLTELAASLPRGRGPSN